MAQILLALKKREQNTPMRRGKRVPARSMAKRLSRLNQTYQMERQWVRERLSELANRGEDTAKRLHEAMVEKEIRERREFLLLRQSPSFSRAEILARGDREFDSSYSTGIGMKLFAPGLSKKIATLAVMAVIAPFLQSCGGYYNTFYNTKKAYKEAREEQKRRPVNDNRPGSGEIQKYDKAIEKASKLLQLYPKSRYVDDALLLIGECFFYKQEYLKAQRKFEELITLFPKSGLVPRAQLWLAKTSIELNDYAGAEQALQELETREKKGAAVDQAHHLLGEIYFRQKQYAPAAQEYEAAANKLDDDKIRGEAYLRLGECCMQLKEYNRAAEAFRRASGTIKNNINLQFQARLQQAVALKLDQKLNAALEGLSAMQKEFSAHRDLPLVKIEMAECADGQGKTESAIKQYLDICETYQRTEAAAAAFFGLGAIYERRGDFGKAKENYDNVRRESSRSEKLSEAERRSKAIGALIKLRETVTSLERQRAILSGEQTATAQLAANKDKDKKASDVRKPISRFPRRARNVDPAALSGSLTSKDPQKIAAELAKSKILLAELFLFNFSRPDSAMREYLDVFEFFPQTEYAPQAMYSLAYILGEAPATLVMRDSILQVLAGQYGNTLQGQGAKRRLGRTDTLALTKGLPELLRQAEENLVKEKDAKRAVRLYEEFLQREPDSKYAAQSLYAVGWIYEHELADNKQALAAYKKLLEAHPESPMARRIRPKVLAVEQPAKPKAAPTAAPPVEVAADTTAATDSAAVVEDEIPLRLKENNLKPEQRRPVKDDDEMTPPEELKGDEAEENKDKKDKAKPPEPPGL